MLKEDVEETKVVWRHKVGDQRQVVLNNCHLQIQKCLPTDRYRSWYLGVSIVLVKAGAAGRLLGDRPPPPRPRAELYSSRGD